MQQVLVLAGGLMTCVGLCPLSCSKCSMDSKCRDLQFSFGIRLVPCMLRVQGLRGIRALNLVCPFILLFSLTPQRTLNSNFI